MAKLTNAIFELLLYKTLNPRDKKELRVQSKLAVWENVSAALAEYTEQTGGQLNEGTSIKPEFTTTHTTVIIPFKLLNKSHQISQVRIAFFTFLLFR